MDLLGWISWGIVFVCAVLLSYGCLVRKPVPTTLLVEAICFWGLVIVFLFAPWPKIYILWLMPVVFIAVKYLVPIFTREK